MHDDVSDDRRALTTHVKCKWCSARRRTWSSLRAHVTDAHNEQYHAAQAWSLVVYEPRES